MSPLMEHIIWAIVELKCPKPQWAEIDKRLNEALVLAAEQYIGGKRV